MKQFAEWFVLTLCVLLITTVAGINVATADGSGKHDPVAVVVDFSGSMKEADADAQGTTRIQAAKTAVKGLLAEMPKESQLGLVVYGANNDSCGDIQTINPVGKFDAAALGAKVDSLQAKGNTPIGPALKHAAKELQKVEGKRSIILVSDGEPNCEPPPACDVAKELAKQGIDLTVHTVGFKLGGNAKAKRTLQCIAEATGGGYTDVADAKSLQEALKQETIRATEGYTSQGVRVQGSTKLSQPEELLAGQYVVKMPTGKEHPAKGENQEFNNRLYFTVPFQEGWDVVVSATLVTPSGELKRLRDGSDASKKRSLILAQHGSGTDFVSTVKDHQSQSGFLDVGDLTATITMPGKRERANADGQMHFSINRAGDAWQDQELDVEFVVAYVKQDGASSQASDPGKPPTAIKASKPAAKAGGSSFNTATELKPGETISDTINREERRYFSVPVQYGQNLQAQLETKAKKGGLSITLGAVNPMRQKLPFAPGGKVVPKGHLSEVTSVEGTAVKLDGTLQKFIAPQHLGESAETKPFGVDGKQYLVVSRRTFSHNDTDAAQEFTLTTNVWGDPVQADKTVIRTLADYEEQFGAVDPSPSPSAPASPSAQPSPSPSASTAPAPDKPSDHGGIAPLTLALGGAGALCVVGGVAWLILRRRRG